MFCDETTIKLKAGNGGNGSISFRREKYIPKGGPDGGDGGKGGSIIIRANENINTLSDINSRKHYKALDGENGSKKNMAGKNAEDLIIEAPVGTVVYTQDKKTLLADLVKHGQEFIAAKGGKGGFGNQNFVSSIHQAPTFAESGEPGEEREISLELKLVADVGLIGMPSVGKSTLISVVSNARPKIAAYEFTTLVPNLGVVDMTRFGGDKGSSFVIADMPGLIEGASQGKGLGIQFLKHIARTKVLVHLIDPLRENPGDTFIKITKELEKFDKNLVKKPTLVAISKIDAVQESDLEKIEKELKKKLKKLPSKIFRISAVSGKGLKELFFEVLKTLQAEKEKRRKERVKQAEKIEASPEVPVLEPHKRLVKYEIVGTKRQDGHRIFMLKGDRIEQLVKMTNIANDEGIVRLYHYFNKMGIVRALRREKIADGDMIEIAGKKIPYKEFF